MRGLMSLNAVCWLAGAPIVAPVIAGEGAAPCDGVGVLPGGPGDCNQNGFPDACDLAAEALGFTWSSVRTMVPEGGFDFSSFYFSTLDADSDGDGDFVVHLRGQLLAFLNRGDGAFVVPVASPAGADSVFPRAAVDVQGDGIPDLIAENDLIFSAVQGVHFGHGDGTFHNLFLGGPPPAPPGRLECGEDPTPDDLGCNDCPPCP
jgi:hypothetical protein